MGRNLMDSNLIDKESQAKQSPTQKPQSKVFALDTNVLVHDPNAILNFHEHHVLIPLTVLEELDNLKTKNKLLGADCRQAIRMIDQQLEDEPHESIEKGVPIKRFAAKNAEPLPSHGTLSIMMTKPLSYQNYCLPNDIGDNKIINGLCQYQQQHPDKQVILVTKDINMRLKARACGIGAEDYHNDQLVTDVDSLPKGYKPVSGSFWDLVEKVKTETLKGITRHTLPKTDFFSDCYVNEFIIDESGFVGRISEITDRAVVLIDLHQEPMLHTQAWGLTPRDIYQAMALHLLLDPDMHLVNITGAAGSGKTILALAAAIEMTVEKRLYNRIIAMRSTQNLDEDIGFLPGSEEEKMAPWLGAITDNLEALHHEDENTHGSIEYIMEKVPIQFKSLNYIRGRSFQRSIILLDECQNLTPHQIKTIITRAGKGSKVICLGNLAQIDTPYLNALSSGLTYMTERLKGFKHSGCIALQGVPRSALAEYAEAHL